jgi:neutral ceramidase
LASNPSGLVDRSVPVLRVDSAEGKPRAILFGYACHNTTLPPRHLSVSGDYAGYAKAYVEKQFPGAEAMFLQGCGGDANPHPREQVAHALAHGEELGKEVCRVLGARKLQTVRGPLACAMVAAELPLETPDRQKLEAVAKDGFGGAGVAGLHKQTARQMLATLDAGGKLPETYRAPVTAWQFGADLTLVALPDEVVVDYVPRLEEALGPLRLWVAAYCHEVAGYIPSRRVLREGGYETRGLYYGTGWFADGVEDALVNAAREAAAKAGRGTSQRTGR